MGQKILYIVCITLLFTYANADADVEQPVKDNLVEKLNEDNWDQMLSGEWMVEFYAPWCPACRNLEPTWEHLAQSKKDLNINVAKVDVTTSPGLSGRFLVTALPTIFHVHDGIFRQYRSPRDKASLIEFVTKKVWTNVEPVPDWKNPTSIQMATISLFFRISQILRIVHNRLLEELGLPTWGSYIIFALVTIICGAILGMIIVCLIDCIYPPKKDKKLKKTRSDICIQGKLSDEEEMTENVSDDLIDEEELESEEIEEQDKDVKTDASSPNVRKRKPRKAD